MQVSVLVNLLIAVMVLSILSSLAMGLYYLVSDQGTTKRTVKALTFRITLSLILFSALSFGLLSGWLKPHAPFAQMHKTE